MKTTNLLIGILFGIFAAVLALNGNPIAGLGWAVAGIWALISGRAEARLHRMGGALMVANLYVLESEMPAMFAKLGIPSVKAEMKKQITVAEPNPDDHAA